MKKIALLITLISTLAVTVSCMADEKASEQTRTDIRKVPAFPGAEGYGKYAVGGRGGRVIAVTNLNGSGPGSLRAACEAEGPRIVVFKVAGTIDGGAQIRHDSITIAGQTAPGDGITIKGGLDIAADNVIVRYLRVRPDARNGSDAVSGKHHKNIILDHVSACWARDEVMSVYAGDHMTIQWCMITEACAKYKNGKSTGHQFGGIWGNNYSTYHHNLIADNVSRNPRFGSGSGSNDFRNNVLYNWAYQSVYGGEKNQPGDDRYNSFQCNMVANYYKAGPATQEEARSRIVDPSTRHGQADAGKWWVSDNYVAGFPDVTADNWKGVRKQEAYFRLSEPWPAMPIAQQTAQQAYEAVLAKAGCSLPVRDAIDARIVKEVRSGTASKGENGIISNPEEAGGWVAMKTAPAPADSDGDGMPDAWEATYGLDANNADDNAQDPDKDGYTNVEECLNGTDPTVFVDYTKPENNVNTLK